MRHHKGFFISPTLVLLSTALAFGACGSDASSPPGGSGGSGGGGGGGKLTAADAEITGTVTQCAGTSPAPLPEDVEVSPCTTTGCADAACIPGNLLQDFVSADTDLSLLGTCEDGAYCVPIDYVATTGDFLPKTCTSLLGAEGRCISNCIPQVADRLDQLPQADCNPNERCAPCYDPITGEDTQACSQGCDTGPTQQAVTFPRCGNDAGVCVSPELIPAELRPSVPQADCADGSVCAPELKALDIDADFTPCEPSSELLAATNPEPGPNGQLGGCVPAYLVEYQEPAVPEGAVLQDSCAAGELCAPCNNPLNNGAPTGACPLE